MRKLSLLFLLLYGVVQGGYAKTKKLRLYKATVIHDDNSKSKGLLYQVAEAFRLPLGLKDINLTLKTASDSGVPMPIADLVRNRFISAIANGRDHLDWGAIAKGPSDDAGL